MPWPLNSRMLISSAALAASALIPLSAFSQTAAFSAHQLYNSPNSLQVAGHADFNGDGREDMIVAEFGIGITAKGLLFLSNGDGTYDAPIAFPVAAFAGALAIGDFNHDGKLDFVANGPTGSQLNVYLGNGDGTFQPARTIASGTSTTETIETFVAGDFNHDNKTDIIEAINDASNNNILQVWNSNGDGTFTAGQRITSNVLSGYSGATLGDFDGDGKPDFAIEFSNQGQSTVQVWFGDGNGNLTSPITWNDPNGYEDRFSPDISEDQLSDGHSTIAMSRFIYGLSGSSQAQPQIGILRVNSARTFGFSVVTTTNCPDAVTMADFNGDGIDDLVYSEVACSSYSAAGVAPYTVAVKYASSPGVYGAEQTIYNNAYFAGGDLQVLKTTQGTKPDLVFDYWTQAPATAGGPAPQAVEVLNNDTTTGLFPACGTPNLVEGVNVCAPATASATSPVVFSVSSAGPAPMRTVAVWADGTKVAQQLAHSFSQYSFLDQSVSLAAGNHSITVFGTAVDGTLQQKTFTLNVGGTGGSCAAPSSPGVAICTPGNGNYVNSPTPVTAAANIVGTLARMEIWVDYAKYYTETTSTSLSTSLTLPIGYHRFDVFAVNSAGTKYQTTAYATVGNGSACSADASYTVHVCSPLSGSIASAPVRALATAHVVGTLLRMEVWVDYAKLYTETTSLTLDTSLSLGSGNHRFDFFAVNTAGAKSQTTVYATVP